MSKNKIKTFNQFIDESLDDGTKYKKALSSRPFYAESDYEEEEEEEESDGSPEAEARIEEIKNRNHGVRSRNAEVEKRSKAKGL